MKKIYLFAAAAAICSMQASAQETQTVQNFATMLQNNQVYYLTTDTCTIQDVLAEDEATGEPITVKKETFWNSNNIKKAYEALNLPSKKMASSSNYNLQFRTRKNYVDPETGFNMPAGFYRGYDMLKNSLELSGYVTEETYLVGFQNVKSLILYFAPMPSFWEGTNWSIYLNDYPTGRVQARYMTMEDGNVGGTALSNQAYREIHISQTKNEYEKNGLAYTDATTLTCGFARDPEDGRKFTIDQVYKVKVNLDNQLDGAAYEGIFASETKKAEFANLMCETNGYESEMSYYFADVNTTRPNTDNAAYSSSATGYDCYENKWGVKLPWSSETIMQLQIKSRLILAGYAIICGTEGASTLYMNAADGKSAAWASEGKAYGNYADEITDAIENTRLDVAAKNGRIYDLSGKQTQTSKGLNIMNGKVVLVK